MPPFQYDTFVDPYVGSIAQLMGQQGQRQADAAERIAAIRAQEATQRGDIWGGAIQGIGNLASTTLTEWNSPEARRQRELDKANEFLRNASQDVSSVSTPYYQAGNLRRDPGSPGSTIQHLTSGVTTGDLGMDLSDPQIAEAYAQAIESGQLQPSGQISSTSAALPEMPVGARPSRIVKDPGTIEQRTQQIVGAFVTPEGNHDLRAQVEAMRAEGFSPDIINTTMERSSQTNALLEAYDAREKKGEDEATVLMGQLASDVLDLSENGVLPLQELIDVNLSILEPRFGKEGVNRLRVEINSLSEDKQIETLRGMADAADRITGYEYVSPEAVRVGGATARRIDVSDPDPFRQALNIMIDPNNNPGDKKYDDAFVKLQDMNLDTARADEFHRIHQRNIDRDVVDIQRRSVAVEERLISLRESAGIGGGGLSGLTGSGSPGNKANIFDVAEVILNQPSAYSGLTPTLKGELIPILAELSDDTFNFSIPSMTPSVAGALSRLDTSLDVMESLDWALTQESGIGGKFEGIMQRLWTTTGEDANLSLYLGASTSILPALARSAGEVGNLAVQEQTLYNQLAPKITDPINVRRGKYAALRFIIDKTRADFSARTPRPLSEYLMDSGIMDFYNPSNSQDPIELADGSVINPSMIQGGRQSQPRGDSSRFTVIGVVD
jgi:hypothetical protein